MNKLTDEILNKFLDNELDQATHKMVKEQLDSSVENRKRLKALQAVHNELSKLKESELGDDFTTKLMKKIAKKSKAKKDQKIFVFSVSSIFVAISVLIIGYVVFAILSAPSAGQGSEKIIGNTVNAFQSITDPIKNFLTGKNIAIIGSVFSFGLLLSIYFVFDTLKRVKHSIGKSN
ncbi:MAG TPA: hypothetical protein VKA26_04230 [Ignavibacteriaceae bacterium]|nr:hypothetical protein [Ignavibacteriaceae bacterium]